MKAILILDMPKSCYECPLMSEDMYCKGFIPYTYENVLITKMCVEDYVLIGTRHSHCPLKPMPQKEHNNGGYRVIDGTKWFYDSEHDDGWNDCIDKLVGEEE